MPDVDSAGTKDPVLLHAPTRRSVGYFGAVRLRDGKFLFCREAGKFNGATFFGFMKSLRRHSIRTGRRVVVITDNAKYHRALLHRPWREEHILDFSLDYLPPLLTGPESHRTSLEAYTASVPAQPLLQPLGSGDRLRRSQVLQLDKPQRNLTEIMRNYLSRYV
jgi:hypothetical protein